MRRISALALAIGFAATLVACGGSQPAAETGGSQPAAGAEGTAPVAEGTPDEQRGIRVHDGVGKCDLAEGTAPSPESCAAINCTFSNGKCIPGGSTEPTK